MNRGLTGAALIVVVAVVAFMIGRTHPAREPEIRGVSIDKQGTVSVPAYQQPLSSYMTDKAKEIYTQEILNPAQVVTDQGIEKYRETHNANFYGPRLAKMEKLYPINIEDTKIGGVHVEVITPKDGVSDANKDRVLIEVHGGSFQLGAVLGGRVESAPIANVGKIKVVAVDYRQGPENKFPAGSEDTVAVYKELLKTYKPENIGLFGCSGGGVMTSETLAWIILKEPGLPVPGAAGILCSGIESFSGGDSRYWGLPLDVFFSAAPPPAFPNPPPFPMAYFSDVDLKDPLVGPVYHLDVLAKFPPSLILTGTRGIDASSAAYAHTQMAKAGAESELFLFEGMWHAFIYDMDVPEAQDAYNVIWKFFDKHLGK
jgi:acetyl esterase/lipase